MLSCESSGIYKIVNKINGKYYVGSSKNLTRRWKEHLTKLKAGKHINVKLQNAFNKYGESNFEFQILELCDVDVLPETEERYLSLTDESSYNIAKTYCGGDNFTNNPRSEEIRQLHSVNGKKRWESKTEEEKRIYSENQKGVKNHNYGKTWSDELRRKVSIKMKGVNNSPITGKTMEEYYGQEKAEKLKKQQSEFAKTRTGSLNPFYGKKHTEETRRKLSDANKGKRNISCYRPVVIENVIYDSVTDAARSLKVCLGTIVHRIKSKNPKYNSYHYLDSHKCQTTISEESTLQAIGDGNGNIPKGM